MKLILKLSLLAFVAQTAVAQDEQKRFGLDDLLAQSPDIANRIRPMNVSVSAEELETPARRQSRHYAQPVQASAPAVEAPIDWRAVTRAAFERYAPRPAAATAAAANTFQVPAARQPATPRERLLASISGGNVSISLEPTQKVFTASDLKIFHARVKQASKPSYYSDADLIPHRALGNRSISSVPSQGYTQPQGYTQGQNIGFSQP